MNELPHRYDIERTVASEIATGTKLYFCTGCGRPRAPKMRRITHDTVCQAVTLEEVEARVNSRMTLLAAMIAGRDFTNQRNYKKYKRRPGDSNPAPRKD